jgi:hypothetical protein
MSKKKVLFLLVVSLIVGVIFLTYRLPRAEASAATVYRYDFVCIAAGELDWQFKDRFTGWLNTASAAGWDLVSYNHAGPTCIDVIWRRPRV